MDKYHDNLSGEVFDKEDAVYEVLFGSCTLAEGQMERIEAKLDVLIELAVKNESQKINNLEDLNGLAGYERFVEVK